MDYGNGDQPYFERNAKDVNLGEKLFESWCDSRGMEYYRLGYDEKTGPIIGWYKVAQAIRQMPDYLVKANGRMAVVSVKGTWKFKVEDYKRLDWFEETYATDRCPLRFVFATPSKVVWANSEQVKKAYEASTKHGEWSDGKAWRELDSDALGN